MKTKALPSARLLRRLIDYNPSTGEIRWKKRPVWMFSHGMHGSAKNAEVWNGKHAGQVAGHITFQGYVAVSIFKNRYLVHRLAWVIVSGKSPGDQIDHINGDRLDNSIANLRDVSISENCRNQALQRRSKARCHGVRWHKRDRAWTAHIKTNGVQKHLGTFASEQAAIDARKAAERELGFHPNHGRAA